MIWLPVVYLLPPGSAVFSLFLPMGFPQSLPVYSLVYLCWEPLQMHCGSWQWGGWCSKQCRKVFQAQATDLHSHRTHCRTHSYYSKSWPRPEITSFPLFISGWYELFSFSSLLKNEAQLVRKTRPESTADVLGVSLWATDRILSTFHMII